MSDTFHWLNVQRIAEELADAHPDLDPAHVNFVDLRNLVRSLDGFEEREGHPVNERILESIQQHWIEERDDIASDDD
ncbi:MAG: Fe-S cluster assembly protein IscX [Phycisphaeraceae bacterium]|nr:MAG: Fe-S cluster assembly protein IscX [Phycisphaeraceae bacterium]